jgi:DNA-binding MarR family transcriptional regulator
MQPDFSSLANDKIIHERARLLILSYLASRNEGRIPFGELKDALEFTSGNLSIQLKTLKDYGYIAITKVFKDNKPLTRVAITSKGGQALKRYLGEMENLIKHFQNQQKGV